MNFVARLGLMLTASLALVHPAAPAQTFSNPAPINVPTSQFDGRAPLYPSPIAVTGAPTSIGYLSVTLNNVSHTWVSNLNVLLTSPTGQKILLMSNTNGSGDAINNTLTFIPDGIATLPNENVNVVSGFYACSVYLNFELPSPAPAGPFATSLAPLIGTNANGTWNLYVFDSFAPGDDGAIAGGWSISFSNAPAAPLGTAFTYQGVLSAGGAPLSGNANVRFTLCNSPTAPLAASAQALPVTRNLTGIQNGLVTTALDFGSAIDGAGARWLNIEVESSPGSGFVTLSPRQPITPTPQARVAQRAINATNATNATNAINAINATNATNATQLVPGRARIRGEAGGSFDSPGIWFSSPISAPVDRAFIGQRDDTNVGLFGSAGAGWAFNMNTESGNVGIGTTTPSTRLHVADTNAFAATIESSNTLGTWLNVQNTSAGGRYWRMISTGSANGEGAGNLILGHGTGSGLNTQVMTLISSTGNVGIGTTNPTQRLTVAGNVLANNVAVPSSGRFKHNVLPMNDALEKVLKLDGVSFDWNPDFAKDRPGREHDLGFVAEDVAKVFPEVVFYDAEGNVTGMDYSRLTAVAVQAIKQQQALRNADRAELDALRADAARRDAENAELKARLEAIEAALLRVNK